MKTKKKLLLILIMISLFGLILADLNVNKTLDNAVAYINKIVFTTNGDDGGKTKVVVYGVDGSITMSRALNITSGALKN